MSKKIQARNNFVFIKRDETKTKLDGLFIPGAGQEKPHEGLIVSIGRLVRDKSIATGDKALFHKGVGFEITYESNIYLVLMGEEIIATI